MVAMFAVSVLTLRELNEPIIPVNELVNTLLNDANCAAIYGV